MMKKLFDWVSGGYSRVFKCHSRVGGNLVLGLTFGLTLSLAGCAVRQNPAPISSLQGFASDEPMMASTANESADTYATQTEGATPGKPYSQTAASSEETPQLVMKPRWQYVKQKPKKIVHKPQKLEVVKQPPHPNPRAHHARHIDRHVHKPSKAKAKVVAKKTQPVGTITKPKPVQLAKSSHISTPVNGTIKSQSTDMLQIAATKGEKVIAAKSGKVLYTGPSIKGSGQMVIVKHDDGVLSAYSHLGKVSVKEGQAIAKGKTLGTVSRKSGQQTIAFQVRKDGTPLNPIKWLGA